MTFCDTLEGIKVSFRRDGHTDGRKHGRTDGTEWTDGRGSRNRYLDTDNHLSQNQRNSYWVLDILCKY